MPTSDITNNTFATATRLTGINNAPQGGVDQVLNRIDNPFDFYRFTTSGSSNLRINLTGITGDVQLSLYKVASDTVTPTETNRVTLRPGSTGRLSESYTSTSDPVLADVTPGTYYIKVEQAGIALPNSTYSLGVFASTSQDTISALWRNPNGGLDAWQLGSAAIDTKASFTVADAPAALKLIGTGDFNADGVDDIIWKDSVKKTFVLWFMENGTVKKSTAEIKDGTGQLFTRDDNWAVVGIDDIDKDGLSDILLRNETSGEIEACFIYGLVDEVQGSIADVTKAARLAVNFKLYSDWQILGFSQDRVLWRNINSNVITTWEIGRDGLKVNRPVSFTLPQDWKVVAFQDFNNDGTPDVLWRNNQIEAIVPWRMSSTEGDPADRKLYILANDFRISTIADFNGDRRQDVLFWNGVNGNIVVWETQQDVVNKDNKFVTDSVTSNPLNIPSDSFDVVLARDFDGDQKADILFRQKITGRTVFWKMDGSVRQSSVFGLDNVPLDSVSPGIDYPGYRAIRSLRATTRKQAQFTAGLSRANPFDLGVLDGSGSFSDLIGGTSSSDRQDWYKFKVEVSSLLTGLNLTGASIGNAKAEVFLENSNTPLAEADWRKVLEIAPNQPPKTYYLRVTPDSTKQSIRTPYTLNVTGRLGLTNLKANSITIDKTSLPLDINSANNKVTVTAFQFENNGDFAANNVTVGYYLSRDGVLDTAVDRRLTKVSTVGTVARGIAEKVNPNGTITLGTPNVVNLVVSPTITLELPGANDAFWSQSGASYQIIAVVDPDKAVTNETKRDDNAIASTAFTITKAGGLDLTGDGFTSTSSVSKTGTVTGSFTIKNLGGVALAAGQSLKVKLYLSTDATVSTTGSDLFLREITITESILAGGSLTQNFSFALPTGDDAINYWVDNKPAGSTQLQGFIGMIIDTAGSNILDSNVGNNQNQVQVGKDRVAVTITGL